MSTMDTILTDNEELHTTIETYPLHPMCEWHPPTSTYYNERNFFVKFLCYIL